MRLLLTMWTTQSWMSERGQAFAISSGRPLVTGPPTISAAV
ncbi:hypothetical protein ACFZBZ_01720 [Streptomyces sp. NPDC008196]